MELELPVCAITVEHWLWLGQLFDFRLQVDQARMVQQKGVVQSFDKPLLHGEHLHFSLQGHLQFGQLWHVLNIVVGNVDSVNAQYLQ